MYLLLNEGHLNLSHFIIVFFFFFDLSSIRMIQPMCIGRLLSYFSSDSSNKMDSRELYAWAFVFLLSMYISLNLFHLVSFEILHCGMKMRVACCSVIYRKVPTNLFDIIIWLLLYLWRTFILVNQDLRDRVKMFKRFRIQLLQRPNKKTSLKY